MKRILATLLACMLLAPLAPAAMAEEPELTAIRVVGMDNSYTFDGNTYYLSDVVNGTYKTTRYDLLMEKLASRGLTLEWDLVTSDQYDTYLRTCFASGMDADIYDIKPLDDQSRRSMVENGFFLPFSALYPYSDGTIQDYLENDDGKYNVAYQSIDGELYWMNNLGVATSFNDDGSYIGSFVVGLIRLDWCEKLGVDVPSTPDELVDFVLACRENDVNGNGVADEMIFMAAEPSPTAAWYGVGMEWYYVGADGTFTSPWYNDGWYDYLKFVKRLYDLGVLEMTSAMNNLENENKLIAKTHWGSRNVTFKVADDQPEPMYTPYLIQPYEDQPSYLIKQSSVNMAKAAYALNAKTENIEALAKLLDFTFTLDYVHLAEGFHPELEGITWKVDPETGVNIEMPDPIEDNFDNYAAINSKNYALWNETMPKRTGKRTIEETKLDWSTWAEPNRQFMEEYSSYPYYIIKNAEDALCALSTEEESETIADYKTDLETYMSELAIKMVMGEKSFENRDEYIKEMQKMGLDELLAVYQARYERAQNALDK